MDTARVVRLWDTEHAHVGTVRDEHVRVIEGAVLVTMTYSPETVELWYLYLGDKPRATYLAIDESGARTEGILERVTIRKCDCGGRILEATYRTDGWPWTN